MTCGNLFVRKNYATIFVAKKLKLKKMPQLLKKFYTAIVIGDSK